MASDPRERRLQKKYGITVAEYDAMFDAQNGVCAVCGRPPKKIRLAVDHDHKGTGRTSVRGLCCSMCNRKIIGVIERYKVKPERIAEYLRRARPFAAVCVLAVVLLTGCAARKPAQNPGANPFWRGSCAETIPAKADGYQHFLCTTKDGREVEVNLRVKQ